ncbi:hypothetical protein FKM82_019213 [Ascaphus truei]
MYRVILAVIFKTLLNTFVLLFFYSTLFHNNLLNIITVFIVIISSENPPSTQNTKYTKQKYDNMRGSLLQDCNDSTQEKHPSRQFVNR